MEVKFHQLAEGIVVSDVSAPSIGIRDRRDECCVGVAIFARLPEKDAPNQTCVRRHLVRRENAHNKGAFYGCSNWPYCEDTQPPCPACGGRFAGPTPWR